MIADVYEGDSAAFASWMSGFPPELLNAWAVTPTGVQTGLSQYDIGPSALGPQTTVLASGSAQFWRVSNARTGLVGGQARPIARK